MSGLPGRDRAVVSAESSGSVGLAVLLGALAGLAIFGGLLGTGLLASDDASAEGIETADQTVSLATPTPGAPTVDRPLQPKPDAQPRSDPGSPSDPLLQPGPEADPEPGAEPDPQLDPESGVDPRPTPDPDPPAAVRAQSAGPVDAATAERIAGLLAPMIKLPSDCPLPLDDPESLPNADRSYRSGTHQGIDFICGENGRAAVASLDGRAVIVSSGYREPSPADRLEVLKIAAAVDETPPWTLTMLYGNHVVVDHGIVAEVGHVVSLYAHLESVPDDLITGQRVEAGQTIGLIGNTGTSSAASGTERARSLHLHWELYVDDRYLGAGLSPAQTRTIYARLFGSATPAAQGTESS